MFHDLTEQIMAYPVSEFIHLLQGAIAGWLVARGYLERCLVNVSIAVFILSAFACYEIIERDRIGDPADLDFAVALIFSWVAAGITLGIAKFRR